jgi:hypothetical protein
VRMWRAMCERYALWDCPPQQLEEFLRDMLQACARVFEWCLGNLSREQLLWVDFEALRTDPRNALTTVAHFTGRDPNTSGPSGWDAVIDRALESVPVHSGQRSEASQETSTRELEDMMDAMRERFGIGRANSP